MAFVVTRIPQMMLATDVEKSVSCTQAIFPVIWYCVSSSDRKPVFRITRPQMANTVDARLAIEM